MFAACKQSSQPCDGAKAHQRLQGTVCFVSRASHCQLRRVALSWAAMNVIPVPKEDRYKPLSRPTAGMRCIAWGLVLAWCGAAIGGEALSVKPGKHSQQRPSVVSGKAEFQGLAPGLVRMEYAGSGVRYSNRISAP